MKVLVLALLGTFALFCSAQSPVSTNDDTLSVNVVTESTNAGGPTDATNSPTPESTTNSAGPTQTPTTIITDGPTTMSPSSTTEKPTPWEWHVNDKTMVCIIAKFHAVIEINYLKTDNATSKGSITLPENAQLNVSESHCGNETQVLQINFKNGNKTGSADSSYVKLTFSETNDKIVIVSDIEIWINNVQNTFVDAKVNEYHGGKSNTSLFGTDAGHSYICTKSSVDFGPLGSISFTDFQIEAFRATNDVTFSLAEDCNADVNNIVPIAVGCSLAALVVVVLVAYLIGRRQKRQRGYESQGL